VSDRNRIVRELRRLKLAASDMRLVAGAAETLAEDEHVACERMLETGLVVTYARSFTPDSKRRRLGDEWAPVDPADQRLHDRLLELRNELYAHTDETDARGIEDVAAMLGTGAHRYAESYVPLDRDRLPAIADLARKQEARFDAAQNLELELGRRNRRLAAGGGPSPAS
jgi:hypothetical protein